MGPMENGQLCDLRKGMERQPPLWACRLKGHVSYREVEVCTALHFGQGFSVCFYLTL